MNENLVKQLADVLENQAVKDTLTAAKSTEEVISILGQNGVAITADELAALTASDELDENNLDAVAGGVAWIKVIPHVVQFFSGLAKGLSGK